MENVLEGMREKSKVKIESTKENEYKSMFNSTIQHYAMVIVFQQLYEVSKQTATTSGRCEIIFQSEFFFLLWHFVGYRTFSSWLIQNVRMQWCRFTNTCTHYKHRRTNLRTAVHTSAIMLVFVLFTKTFNVTAALFHSDAHST